MERAKVYQFLFLSSFLLLGVFYKDFSIQRTQLFLTFLCGFVTQFLCVRTLGLKNISWWSTAITCFGTCLLLRSSLSWVHPLAIVCAIVSKFMIRYQGRHVFNPANLGVVIALLFSGNAWLSPGQWGEHTLLLFWLACLGLWVTQASQTIPDSLLFIAMYASLLAYRNIWLGNPLSIWTHQLQNGSLILFTFFMISDPATLPKAKNQKLFHLGFVALFAYLWQFKQFKPNGLVYGLCLSSIVTPFIFYLFRSFAHDRLQICKVYLQKFFLAPHSR